MVCLEGLCMYSCGSTEEIRLEILRLVISGVSFPKGYDCTTMPTKSGSSSISVQGQENHLMLTWRGPEGHHPTGGNSQRKYPLNLMAARSIGGGEGGNGNVWGDSFADDTNLISNADLLEVVDVARADTSSEPSASTPVPEELQQHPELLSYGLWMTTIVCLALAMLWAVVGALFAVINTATTPVEAITGVPGLYLWNGLAALCNLITIICWAVQFHTHLTQNVLLNDSVSGWTTQGHEVFGYSYWLVVVAMVVHLANIVIIVVGTYERKKKTTTQTPDVKVGNIMLY